MNKFISKYRKFPLEFKASFWYTACSIIQKCISFITMPIFTRILTQSQYGEVTIYNSWLSIFVIFSTLNLQYGSFNTAMSKYDEDREGYIAAVQGLCTVLTAIVMVFFLLFQNTITTITELPFILVVIMLFEILATTVVGFWSGKQRYVYKYKSMVLVTLGMTFLSVCASLIFVLFSPEKGSARIIGNAAILILFGIVFFLLNLKRGGHFFNKEYWLYALKFNIPLIPYYLSQMIFNQSDRLMINAMVGTDKAGIYGVAYSLSIILSFVINAVNSSYVPWLYNRLKEKIYKPIQGVTFKILLLISGLLLLLCIVAPEVILIMAGKSYIEAIWIVPPVIISQLFLFLSQMSINVMFYYEDKYSLMRGSIISAVLNLVLNYFCIKQFGYIAAGYTTLVSYIVFWLSNLYYMNKLCKEKIGGYSNKTLFDMKKNSYIIGAFVILIFLMMALYNFMFIRFGILGIVLIVALFNYKRILNFVKNRNANHM